MNKSPKGMRRLFRAGLPRLFSFFLLPAACCIALLASCSATREEQEFNRSLDKLHGQSRWVNADSATVISGDNGLILAIPSGAFMDSLGNPIHGRVHVRIREANTMPQILGAGLETRSGSKILATGGMYQIEAFYQGRSVKVNPDKGIYAFFPTDQRDGDMTLFAGEAYDNSVDWKQIEKQEAEIPQCDPNNPKLKKKCKRCEHLVNRMSKMKTGNKPKGAETAGFTEDYYNERYYWENGVMYFYSSGASKPVLTQKELDDCKKWLEVAEEGRELLARVEQIKEKQKANVGDYYAYRLNGMGWYNIDKFLKQELISFNGMVLDADGKPVSGASVHLLCLDLSLRVHSYTTAEDGTFTLEFPANKDFTLYAYSGNRVGKTELSLYQSGNDVSKVNIAPIAEDQMDEFLKALM